MGLVYYLDTVPIQAFFACLGLVGVLTLIVCRASAKSLIWYAVFVVLLTSLWLTQLHLSRSDLNIHPHAFSILQRMRTLLIWFGTLSAVLRLIAILVERRMTKKSVLYQVYYVGTVSSIVVAAVLAMFQPYRGENVFIHRSYITTDSGEQVPRPPDF